MTPLQVGTSYIHDFGFYSEGNASATHQIVWAVKGLRYLRTPILNSPHTRYLGQRAAETPSTFLAIFMDLSLTPITSIWSAS